MREERRLIRLKTSGLRIKGKGGRKNGKIWRKKDKIKCREKRIIKGRDRKGTLLPLHVQEQKIIEGWEEHWREMNETIATKQARKRETKKIEDSR